MVEPRDGLLGLLDRLVGPGMSTQETLLVLAGSIAGLMFAGILMFYSGASLLLVVLSALIGFDVVGGAVCNGTRTTRAWYHRPGQTWVQHAGFIAPHLAYIIVVAAFFRGPGFDGNYVLIFGAGLLGAAAVILRTPERLKTPVAFAAYLIVLWAVAIGARLTPTMEWFAPALLLKLLLGHLLPKSGPPAVAA